MPRQPPRVERAPAFVQGDRLRTFDVVLANPPFNISDWSGKLLADDIEEIDPGIDETARFMPGEATYPNGCHICEVEIDPETGGRYNIVHFKW